MQGTINNYPLRELGWSLLERFWRAEILSRATLNLSLHCQPYQHGANCRSRQLTAFDNMVDWGWNIINILKLRLRCAEVASGRLFHQIVALQFRILGKYLRQSPPVSFPLEVKHVDRVVPLTFPYLCLIECWTAYTPSPDTGNPLQLQRYLI